MGIAEPSDVTRLKTSPSGYLGLGSLSGHSVQFYESDEYLLQSLQNYVSPGLTSGEAVIVLATAEHRKALEDRLAGEGWNIPALASVGQYTGLDAWRAVVEVVPGGHFDAGRFKQRYEGIIAEATRTYGKVRVFGELVALLQAQRNHAAVLAVEEEWNVLQRAYSFQLLCGYPIAGCAEQAKGDPLGEICAVHHHVIPAESYANLSEDEERLRAVAALQLKAAQLQAEIEEKQRALQMRDEFLSAVSHDLKTPLSVILGQSQRLQRRLTQEGQVDAASLAGLESIARRARMMASIIDELVEITRVQEAPAPVHREDVNLSQLVLEVVRAHAELAPDHNLDTGAVEPGIEAECDRAGLTRVVNSLVNNAVKYSPDRGPISVSLRTETGMKGPEAVLTVRDRGLGIPATDIPHIFDRYFRADNVRGGTSGTGIGLTTSKLIVEQHGGAITVSSTNGDGASFTVRLPLSSR